MKAKMHTSNPIKRRFGHQSKLPLFLYPLSFAPSLTPPWVSFRDFFTHPWTLYFIGLIGLLPSCADLPAAQYIQGFYWIPGITNLSLSVEERIQVGIDAATYQSAVIVGVTLGYWVWLSCCELLPRQGLLIKYISRPMYCRSGLGVLQASRWNSDGLHPSDPVPRRGIL